MSLVCWSGGLDSTLVLHRLATEHRDGTLYHPHGVRALTIHHSQVSTNRPAADAARAAVKEKFRRSGFTVGYLEVTVRQSARSWRTENFIGSSDNPQALLWLTLAVNYLERDESLHAGYIRGDDYWHHAGEFGKAFGTLQELAGRTGRMFHPLEWLSKADVITEAKRLDLYRHCWWCEEGAPKVVRGKARPCGKCKSCRTNDTALWQLSQTATD
jgi:7-cyano-7-deazaguanine synthase in queuosine biosynthesis